MLTHYRAAAWLATQFAATATGPGNAGWGSLHAAIWHLFTPEPDWQFNPAPGFVTPDEWIARAFAAVEGNPNIDFSNWYVVTDVNTRGMHGGVQEFLTTNVVPEPATIFLMGTGLVAVLGMAIVMRRPLG